MDGNVTECSVRENMGPHLNFRPRGNLARVLYEKQQVDRYLSGFDKSQWYHCDLDQLPRELSEKFVQLDPDEETVKFLQKSEEKSDWVPTQIWHSIAKAFLGWFMTQTSINGWLQRGSMFVLSMGQFLKMLGTDGSWNREALMDLGAGDGEVTAHLSGLFANTYVTEMSPTMRTLLMQRGFEVLEVDTWHKKRKFDVIACLNLLDRCDSPIQIFSEIKSALKPDGLVLLALVLPFSAYVESGSKDHRPKDILPIVGSSFEEQTKSIVEDVLVPNGFEVVSWSRVPYLCEGDLQQSYYWLDDVIFVLKLSGINEFCERDTTRT